jgi:TolA-binding protein
VDRRARFGALAAWAVAHWFLLLLALLSCVAVVGGVVTYRIITAPPDLPPHVDLLAEALEALKRGEYAEPRRWADRLRQAEPEAFDPGGRAYVLGVLAARDALEADERNQRRLSLEATRLLEEARIRGFPPGEQSRGLLLLGRCLFRAGEYQAARTLLAEALESNPDEAVEIRFLLAAACVESVPARMAEAIEHNDLILASGSLTPDQRDRALIQRAEIHLQADHLAASLEALGQVPESSPRRAEADVLRARVWLAEALKLREQSAAQELVHQKLDAATGLLRKIADGGLPAHAPVRHAEYLMGVCLQERGDAKAAGAQFERTAMLFPGTAEGLAAAFRRADLLREAGRDAEAVDGYVQVLKAIGPADEYPIAWLRPAELRRRVLEAFQQYLERRNYDLCLRLADTYDTLFSKERQLLATAEVHRARGRDLLSQAARLPGEKAETAARSGRGDLRRAGALFAEAAKLRFATRQYPDDLWEAATSFLEGRGYEDAVRLFREYLANEVRRRQTEAMVGLGEALLALDRVDEAIETLRQCVALYPRDSGSFRARLLAAAALAEKGDAAAAERMLHENLDGPSLTPASKEWRDSLFALGRLLHAQRKYDEAARRLDEAVRRYPDAPPSLEARYLLADSSRQAARIETQKLQKDLVEDVRLARYRRIRELLGAAAEQFRDAQDALVRQQEVRELTPLERAMLRNCYFALGDVNYDLGQYDAAIKAYGLAISRYQNAPEVLEAYLQTARAYRQLNRPQDARGTIEQARVVLGRMKPQAPFAETTNYTAQEWEQVLAQAAEVE